MEGRAVGRLELRCVRNGEDQNASADAFLAVVMPCRSFEIAYNGGTDGGQEHGCRASATLGGNQRREGRCRKGNVLGLGSVDARVDDASGQSKCEEN
jgi:hypothetical protein